MRGIQVISLDAKWKQLMLQLYRSEFDGVLIDLASGVLHKIIAQSEMEGCAA